MASRTSPAARRPAPAWAAGRAGSGRSPSPRCRSRRGATRRSRRTRRPRPRRRRTWCAPASRARGPASPTPCRRLSSPISAMTSGRSPARFCRRARYAAKRSCDSRYTLKHDQVEEGQLEVLGGRIVDVRDQARRDPRSWPRRRAAPGTAPRGGGRASGRSGPGSRSRSRSRGRRDARRSCERRPGRAARWTRRRARSSRKVDVLLPGQADHHPESVALRPGPAATAAARCRCGRR